MNMSLLWLSLVAFNSKHFKIRCVVSGGDNVDITVRIFSQPLSTLLFFHIYKTLCTILFFCGWAIQKRYDVLLKLAEIIFIVVLPATVYLFCVHTFWVVKEWTIWNEEIVKLDETHLIIIASWLSNSFKNCILCKIWYWSDLRVQLPS